MSAIQIVCLVIGSLAVATLIVVLIAIAFGLHRREGASVTPVLQTGTQGQTSPDPVPVNVDDDRPALSAQEISEVFAEMKVSGGYKPTPMGDGK